MNEITTVGVDLAKELIVVCGADAMGRVVCFKQLGFRGFAAWAGLVPRQSSSGGKVRLGTITKRGDTYLRSLLTQGARSALQSALSRSVDQRSHLQHWIVALHARVGYHKTLVAIANKHVCTLWAILAKGDCYDPNAWQRYASTRH